MLTSWYRFRPPVKFVEMQGQKGQDEWVVTEKTSRKPLKFVMRRTPAPSKFAYKRDVGPIYRCLLVLNR